MLQPPGPAGLPLVGNLEAYEQDRLRFLTSCAREYGDIVRFSDQVYTVNAPHLIEQVLTRTNKEFRMPRSFLQQNIGDVDILRWMEKRHLITGNMHKSTVAAFVPQMMMLVNGVLETWQDGQRVAILQDMEKITSSVIARSCFGEDGRSVPVRAAALFEAVFPAMNRAFFFPAWVPTPANLRLHWTLYRLKQTIYAIIEKRRQNLSDGTDLLTGILSLRQEDEVLSEKELCTLLLSVLLAAHGVPAATLSWIWYLLARDPDRERMVHVELQEVLGDQVPGADDLSRLSYLGHVVKEALRLYPPIWLIVRRVASDCELGGYPLVKGQSLLLSPYVVQRDPRFFDEPERFLPERWLDDKKVKMLPKYAYFPFGGGPRTCLGVSLSTSELVLITAAIAQRCRLKLVEGTKVLLNTHRTLFPQNLEMIVECRS